MEYITKNAEETYRLGEEIGSSLKGGEVFALSGDLGAGKTTFIQGVAKGLGIESRIVSPTFILMRKYSGRLNFYHLDVYRLEEKINEQVRDLGITDIWEEKDNVVAIEWAEKIKGILPEKTRFVTFENIDEDKRRIIIDEK